MKYLNGYNVELGLKNLNGYNVGSITWFYSSINVLQHFEKNKKFDSGKG